jgi:hypothetical protein
MRSLKKFAMAGVAAAATLAMASSAGAVIIGISAPLDPKSAGSDQLGDTFTTTLGGLSWQMGKQAFNTGSLTFGDDLAVATIFRFTLNNGVPHGIAIDPTKTFFEDFTTGKSWSASFFNAGSSPNQRVEFTAPAASVISPFDQYRVTVGFVAPVDPKRYSWSASWDNTSTGVPEPAAWALMIGGFGLAGATLRRRRVATLAA